MNAEDPVTPASRRPDNRPPLRSERYGLHLKGGGGGAAKKGPSPSADRLRKGGAVGRPGGMDSCHMEKTFGRMKSIRPFDMWKVALFSDAGSEASHNILCFSGNT